MTITALNLTLDGFPDAVAITHPQQSGSDGVGQLLRPLIEKPVLNRFRNRFGASPSVREQGSTL